MNYLNYFKISAAAAAVAFGLAGMSASAAPVPPAAPPAQDDIVDIRPPIHIPTPFPWIALSVGALGLVGIGATTWAVFRRKKRKLPYEIALERLENTRHLMREDNAELFCLAVSEIVRLFIEEVLPVRAAHRTTNEFLHELVSVSYQPLTAHRDTLAYFLCRCDLAKFARWSLAVQQMESMLESAKAFVIDLGQPQPSKKQPRAEVNPHTLNSIPVIL